MTNPRYKLGATDNYSLYRDLSDSDKTILRNNNVDVVKISGTDGLNAVEIQQTNPVVKIQSLNTGTTGFAALSLGVTNGDSWNLSAGVSGTGNTDPDFGFHISKNDTELVTIRNNGNIGFGTTDPQYSLDIADSIRTQGDFHVTGNIFIDGVTGFADVDNIWYIDGSNNVISNAYSGNYGIGTATPGYKLEVNGDVGVSGNIVPTLDSTFDLGTTIQRFRDLYLDGNTIYIGDAQISAAASTITVGNDFVVGGSLSITGGVDFGDNLNISGILDVGSSAQLNSLGVTTDASITGNTTMTGTLDVVSATQLNSLGVTTDASITGNTTMTGTLDVASATQLNSLGVTTDASITGNTTMTGTLDVASTTQLNSLGVTGNVGIGTDAPTNKLNIEHTANRPVLIERTDANQQNYIQFNTTNTSTNNLVGLNNNNNMSIWGENNVEIYVNSAQEGIFSSSGLTVNGWIKGVQTLAKISFEDNSFNQNLSGTNTLYVSYTATNLGGVPPEFSYNRNFTFNHGFNDGSTVENSATPPTSMTQLTTTVTGLYRVEYWVRFSGTTGTGGFSSYIQVGGSGTYAYATQMKTISTTNIRNTASDIIQLNAGQSITFVVIGQGTYSANDGSISLSLISSV